MTRARAEPSARMRSISAGSCISFAASAPMRLTFSVATSASTFLNAENCCAAEILEYVRHRLAAERGIDADEIFGFGTAFEALFVARKRFGIGFRLLNFLRDRIGVVAHIDPR